MLYAMKLKLQLKPNRKYLIKSAPADIFQWNPTGKKKNENQGKNWMKSMNC